jgi:hypothetical protein
MGENKSSINDHANQKKNDLKNEEEYYSSINKVEDKVSMKKKLEIILSSFKYIFITYISVFYIIPLVLPFVLYLSIGNEDNGILMFIASIFNDLFYIDIGMDSLTRLLISINYWYLLIFNFGWIFEIIGYGTDKQTLFLYEEFLKLELEQTLSYSISILIINIIYVLITFSLFIYIGKKGLTKEEWKGHTNDFEALSDKYQEAYKKSNVGTDKEAKEGGLSNLKSQKKIVRGLLKKYTEVEKINYREIMYNFEKIYKISFSNNDSVMANAITKVTNQQWLDIVDESATIKNNKELFEYIFTYSFKKEHLEVIEELELEYGYKDEKYLKLMNDKTINNNIKKIYTFKNLMVMSIFKNYPINSIFVYLEKQDILFDLKEKLILSNADKIITNELNNIKTNKNRIVDLSYKIIFPMINNEERLSEMIDKYTEFGESNETEIKKMMNEINEEDAEDENTPFNKNFKIYIKNYLRLLTYMIKETFEEMDIVHSTNLDEFVLDSFNEYFELLEEDLSSDKKISKFFTIELETFYNIVDMVLKKESMYNIEIKPFYINYFENLEILKYLKRV